MTKEEQLASDIMNTCCSDMNLLPMLMEKFESDYSNYHKEVDYQQRWTNYEYGIDCVLRVDPITKKTTVSYSRRWMDDDKQDY